MSQIITLNVAEVQENFEFVMNLVSKGHTIKIQSEDGVAMLTPLVTTTRGSEINIPDPEEFVPDPAMVNAYVSEQLADMTRNF